MYEHDHPLPEEGVGTRVERVEWVPYAKIYLQGHKYPLKGYPTADAVAAINVVKKLLPFYPIYRIRQAIMMALYPFTMKSNVMLPVSKEIRDSVAGPLGLILSHIIEYDSAYRVRLQTMLSVMSVRLLSDRPILAVVTMLRENRLNDYIGAHRKIRACGVLLIFWLLVPSHRRSWRAALRHINFDSMVLDEGDRYWLSLRTDYGPLNPNVVPYSSWRI